MKVIDREKIINDLFDILYDSSFAEGCEDKIMAGLQACSDEQLLAK